MSTELEQVQNAVAEFDRVAAGLGELQKKYGSVVFDVTIPKGMEAAKDARQTVRALRYGIENKRTEGKAPLLALGRKLDADAKRITAQLMEIEDPIHLQIKTEEDRAEREKQERIAAEVRRVEGIQERIAELRGNTLLTATSGAALIQKHIDDLNALPVDDSFAEFFNQAQDAKNAGLYRLHVIYDAAIAHEAEQVRIASEREELARLKAAQAKRDAEDKARRDEEDRVAKAARDTESARQAEENRKQAEANQRDRERIVAEDKRQADEAARLATAADALAAAQAKADAPKPPQKFNIPQAGRKALRADMGNGMIVQRGDDGHWIMIKHGSKSGAINVEVMFGRAGIASDVFIGWIDAQIDGKKKRA